MKLKPGANLSHPADRRTGWNGFLLLITVGLAFFYLTRLVNTVITWQFLLQIYPTVIPIYFLLSGVVFSITLLTLAYGMLRQMNWTRPTAGVVFACWSVSALAEGIFIYALGWRNGWEMNVVFWLVANSLIFWGLRSLEGPAGSNQGNKGMIHDIQSRR